jgi:uncharacterized protein
MTGPAPLVYPLARLLTEPPGERRVFPVHGAVIPLPDGLRLAEPLEGRVTIARTNRGVLVEARLAAAIESQCARCLRDIEVPVEVTLDEEALPSVELTTGAPIDTSAEPDVARLDDHHQLDVAELVGEAISLAEPIAPLCEPDCPGLCPTCGERLGPEHQAHPEDEIDPRLEALRAFQVDGPDETG